MRAWWSIEFVPQKAPNFRIRYAPSFVNFAEPSQKTASAPCLPRMSISLSPISSIAWSHEIRCHWPLASFRGYFSRRSPCTISRIAAPLAQWVPRFSGLAQDGSWPVQTPFWTSAVTVQPTEQWVQMFFLMTVSTPGFGPSIAFALRTAPSWIEPTAARPPMARPERARKLRRSIASIAIPAVMAWNFPRLASPFLRLISMAASLLQGLVAVRAVEGLDAGAVGLVALLGLFPAGIVGLRLGRRDRGGDGGHGGRRYASDRTEEIAAIHRARPFLSHRSSSNVAAERARHASIAKACASISMKMRPIVPTGR